MYNSFTKLSDIPINFSINSNEFCKTILEKSFDTYFSIGVFCIFLDGIEHNELINIIKISSSDEIVLFLNGLYKKVLVIIHPDKNLNIKQTIDATSKIISLKTDIQMSDVITLGKYILLELLNSLKSEQLIMTEKSIPKQRRPIKRKRLSARSTNFDKKLYEMLANC